jgi:5'-methylthioadenosine phosphorylase
MCYANISLITDYDVGLEGREDAAPVTHEAVIEVFNANNARVKQVIVRMVERMPKTRACSCGSALAGARL